MAARRSGSSFPYPTVALDRRSGSSTRAMPLSTNFSVWPGREKVRIGTLERAEGGDLAAIREIADRLDGKPAQVIDRPELDDVTKLTNAELHFIAAGGLLDRRED